MIGMARASTNKGYLLFATLCFGCTGQILGSDGPANGVAGVGAAAAGAAGAAGVNQTGTGASTGPIRAGAVRLRRLNVAEYATTIKDWLGVTVDVSAFPPDGGTTVGFDTVPEALPISISQMTRFKDAATAVVATIFGDDPGGVRAKWCSYTSDNQANNDACAQQIVASFAEQAWRRPSSTWPDGSAEATYQTLLSASGPLASYPLEVRLKQALRSILMGPRFLLRVELTDPQGHLDTPSVASRLSYMLWSSAPDATALQANLRDDAELRAELRRMLFNGSAPAPKFERFLQHFPDVWLQLGEVPKLNRDPTSFPKFTPALQSAMRMETMTLFRDLVGGPSAPPPLLSQLLTQKPSVTDPALVGLYGSSPRSGLLTQASVLAVTSVGTRTSAVRRGHWVLDRLLCDPPPPPPATLADQIKEKSAAVDQSAVERERLALLTAAEPCHTCHESMNTIGLGLENYDAIGEYRTQDALGRLIDPSGVLPGASQTFSSGLELADVLAADPRFVRCMAQQLLTYGTGRLYSSADLPLLDSIRESAGGAKATFQAVLEAVVLSPGFRASEGKLP